MAVARVFGCIHRLAQRCTGRQPRRDGPNALLFCVRSAPRSVRSLELGARVTDYLLHDPHVGYSINRRPSQWISNQRAFAHFPARSLRNLPPGILSERSAAGHAAHPTPPHFVYRKLIASARLTPHRASNSNSAGQAPPVKLPPSRSRSARTGSLWYPACGWPRSLAATVGRQARTLSAWESTES